MARTTTLLLILLASVAARAQHPGLLDPSKAREKAPDTFRVAVETTKGVAVIEVERKWAKNGADRFYNLVKIGFFEDAMWFRVIDGFMAQTGIPADPKVAKAWRNANIPDDPVELSNKPGTVSFAMTGAPNSRTTQIFVNTVNNANLDGMRFAPFGRVVHGMEVFENLYSGYGEGAPQGNGPSQGRIQAEGNAYLEKEFPKLDRIKRMAILKSDKRLPLAVHLKIQRTRKQLADMYALLMVYYTEHRRWPSGKGAKFLLKLANSGILDRDAKSMKVFFDPFIAGGPGEQLENLTEDKIGFTGPNRVMRPSMLDANKRALIAQKVGAKGEAPCDGHGICVIYAGGATEFIHKDAFKDGKIVIGPKSPLRRLRTLTPASW